MTVIPFPNRSPGTALGDWRGAELERMAEACTDPIVRGAISGFETGRTEAGDPQLYVLGPAPEHECVVSVSRLGGLYVIEDGQGRIVSELDTIDVLAEQLRGTLRSKKATIIARAAIAWVAIRETFEERIEPVLGEPMEALSHVAPQFVAFV